MQPAVDDAVAARAHRGSGPPRGRRGLRLAAIVAAFLGVALWLHSAPAVAQDEATAGLYRDSRWHLRTAHGGGPADISFTFGRAGDDPIVGDWNGDGRQTVGIRRQGRVYLRDSLSGGPADRVFTYGRADDDVFAGDWNGSGVQTVGVRRGNRFYLRNSNSGGPADIVIAYGRPDDEVVVGDWNANGVDTIGVRRGARFLLRNSNTGGPADVDFRYGREGDLPVAGDFNGDGSSTVGVVRDGRFLLRNALWGGAADLSYVYGRAGDQPLIGSWEAAPPEPQPQVVSDYTTPLVPGQSRNTNIQRAADYIDGDVIEAGQSYSLNQGIGPRTSERGFVPNGYIDEDGDVISVVGGGVSQMATTFLNAAWFAGIQLDEFRPHTIYFERYPMCREATLVWGQLDVVVTNDSPYPITIATDHSPEHVTVSFISRPWADVSSWIGDPYAWDGPSFQVDCGRTVTYPDGTTSPESYSWRYHRAE